MKLSIFVTALLLGTAGCATQADDQAQQAAPASTPAPGQKSGGAAHAAAASLPTLARLVSPEKTLGFQSRAEAASSTLADPLPMFMVGLNPLRAYRAGDDPRPLLSDEQSVMYPVTVDGDVRSAMIVRNLNGEWQTTQYGRATLAKAAYEARKQVAASRGVALAGVYLVEMPAIATRMLGHDEKGVPMLTALVDVPGTDLRAGVSLPAADVFAKLQPLAAQNDGTAPN